MKDRQHCVSSGVEVGEVGRVIFGIQSFVSESFITLLEEVTGNWSISKTVQNRCPINLSVYLIFY